MRIIHDFIIIGNKTLMHSNFSQRHRSINIQLPFFIKPVKLQKAYLYRRSGRWSQKECLRYSTFLSFFKDILQNPQIAVKVRIFEMMADMIITRTSQQCRSHHRKMQLRHQSTEGLSFTLSNIITSVANKYQPAIYEQLSQKYLILIKCFLKNQHKYLGKIYTKSKKNQIINGGWPAMLMDEEVEIRYIKDQGTVLLIDGIKQVEFAQNKQPQLPKGFILKQEERILLEHRLKLMEERLKLRKQFVESISAYIEQQNSEIQDCDTKISQFKEKEKEYSKQAQV